MLPRCNAARIALLRYYGMGVVAGICHARAATPVSVFSVRHLNFMSLLFLLKGLFVGLSISAPVGPMSLLCIRRTLVSGRRGGMLSGLGIATADAVFGAVAAFGLAVVSDILTEHRILFRVVGAVILCLLGMHIFFSKPTPTPMQQGAPVGKMLFLYVSALLLALSNPLGILLFAAVFASSGLADTGGNYPAAVALVVGVGAGSLMWWFGLCSVAALLGKRMSQGILVRINQGSGLLIGLFGLFMLIGPSM